MRYGNTFKIALATAVCLSVISFAQIPEIRITTQNNANPASQNNSGCPGNPQNAVNGPYTFRYVKVNNFEYKDNNNTRNNVTRVSKPDSIRLRGNSTSGLDKKPYRIKFDEKVSLYGKEAAKSWVLLANYYDGTFALNAIAFEMGKRMGLEFTNSQQLVNLWINNSYKGIYQLTEQIQSNKGRVDIREKHNGWLVEWDYHAPASDECMSWFKTSKNDYELPVFIKYPELDEIVAEERPNNPNPTAADSTKHLRYVRNDILALTNKMRENSFPNNGYRDLIDLESFAKYMLIQLVMDNFDFNNKAEEERFPGSNFAYKIDECSKIQAGPLWDFDLAAGVQNNFSMCFFNCENQPAGFPAHYQSYQDPITPRFGFHTRLYSDPAFQAKYKKAWDRYKSDFQAMTSVINTIQTQLSSSITGNGQNLWANNSFMGGGALTAAQFNTEINNLKTWWTNRLNWVDQQLRNIDTSKDVTETTPVCVVSSSSRASSSSAASSSSVSSSSVASSSSVSSSSLASSSSRASSSSVYSSSTVSSSSRSSSSGTTPIFEHSLAQHGMFVRGKSIEIYTQEPSSVKLSVFDLRGKILFSSNIGTGSGVTWNSGQLGMSKVFIVVAEAKGESGKTYKFTSRILP